MGLWRVEVRLEETTFGHIEVEAISEDEAIQNALNMDRYELQEAADWGSCGDEWDIEVFYEEGAEEITPPSVSDNLWT